MTCWILCGSRKHAYIILTPLNPTFSLQGYTLFLVLLKNIDCGYSLEPPRRGVLTSTHNLCFELKYEKHISVFLFFFLSENFRFLEVKFSIYLNRRVFVMGSLITRRRVLNSELGVLSLDMRESEK